MDTPSPSSSQTPVPPPVPSQSHPLQRSTRITLIVLSVIYLILFLPAAVFAFFTSFAFEGGATPDPLLLYLCFLSPPFVILLGTIAAWLLYRFKAYRAALVVGFIPLLELLVILIPIIIFS